MNRPDLWGTVKEVIEDVNEFENPELRQIAQHLWQYCANGAGGTLGEIMAGCQSPGLCRMMTDMAQRGGERGNYEQVLKCALENLRQLKFNREREELRLMVPQAGETYGADAQAAMLLDLQAKIKPDLRRAGGRM